MDIWSDIDTAPRDGTFFMALVGGVPYLCRYDEIGRLLRYTHTDEGPRAVYRVHHIDGKRLLEEIRPAKRDFKPSWVIWSLGFECEPTHWMPVPCL